MKIRLAFAGFRHAHIFSLYGLAGNTPEIEVVAACEEDDATRKSLAEAGKVKITHSDFSTMMSEVQCDAVAIGDYYAKRGALAIKALELGKHVIADKPICTNMEELNRIEKLLSEKNLKLGCMLDMRDIPQIIGVRNLIRKGMIGDIHAISFGGQHPLMLGVRPAWYFEPGKHGGTINDIAVHAIDFIPWVTGLSFETVNSARCWNAFATDYPHFKDASQMMLTMNNGCGVLGDVSYFVPDSFGYSLPYYWRTTFFGRKGIIETFATAQRISIAVNGEKELKALDINQSNPGGYLKSFLNDLAGTSAEEELNTASVLKAAKIALTIQEAGDKGLRDLSLK
ncbi:MAG: hypothetical protein A2017_09350 [Lentisphaerae bacterium GWF2_44_16]|nr:MAG: hypothetical protein A2017_09350 [Lentisphaerae bacterium GWF2_44_16]